MNFFTFLGNSAINFFQNLYFLLLLGWKAFAELRRLRLYRRQVIEQFYAVGIKSLPVVFLASVFTGMVISAQAVHQMEKTLIPRILIGAAILKAVLVELGPVLTALILAGRMGAGIAAEIGTMKVSEQVDALESLALEPAGFLVMPRVLAGFLMLPLLNVVACILSIITGFITANLAMGLSFHIFGQGMRWIFRLNDVWISSLKAFCFGGLITWVGCYFGLNCTHGAKGVGRATTTAVIVSLISILLIDYIIAELFPM